MKGSKMWGGRFSAAVSDLVEQYTESVSFDRELWSEDIAGSKAHARMLARQGIISKKEAEAIVEGLDRIKAEIESGTFTWRTDLEDVHMNIESRLTELIGDAGKKLHTGRSRNDQVGLDFRLFVTGRVALWREGLVELVRVLVARAEEHRATILPGYTHLQPAQPVSLAQHLLAYATAFRRDCGRLGDALARVMVSPLGAAALAGTTYPLDPASVAEELGLPRIFANSMDAVAERDFVLEPLFGAALVMAHLSRLCEEIILWSNPGFSFVRLPDAYATGSSIMPQKKNPDVAEIMRGKTGRVYGSLVSMLTTVKGLPMTYNRDLQEDKEPFLDADRTVADSLALMAGMMAAMGFEPEAMRRAVKKGYLNATELADYLAARGLPFREAHHATGAAVAYAETKGCGLEDLSLEELGRFSELVGEDVYEVLDYDRAIERRKTPGSTGPESVDAQLRDMRAWLETFG